jgi:hypothetical protein
VHDAIVPKWMNTGAQAVLSAERRQIEAGEQVYRWVPRAMSLIPNLLEHGIGGGSSGRTQWMDLF